MTANERFEIMAAVFYRRTGMLAPGKDAALASEAAETERHESWADFQTAYGEVVRDTMEVCDRWLVRQSDSPPMSDWGPSDSMGCMPRPSTGHPDVPVEHRCNICGGVVHFDGTAPVAGNWGGRPK